MVRGFLLLSLLFTIALIAIFGFRGQKSTGSPLEVFPDMVRQVKVRAQAPSNFFADGRGPRLPIAGTVPIGYEMPKPQTIATPAAAVEVPASHPRLAFSVGTDYYDTGKMGDHWGTGIAVEVTPQLLQRGRERGGLPVRQRRQAALYSRPVRQRLADPAANRTAAEASRRRRFRI